MMLYEVAGKVLSGMVIRYNLTQQITGDEHSGNVGGN
jgi:hypothetical protein